MLLAGVMVTAGLVVAGLSVAQLKADNPHPQMAQATHPLQSTPGAETKPSAPAEPTTTGDATVRHAARARASGFRGTEGRRPQRPAARAGREDRAADQGKIGRPLTSYSRSLAHP